MVLCADLGLLDLLQLQDKLPGLLLYHVALGGLNGDTLLQQGSVDTLLSLATGQSYPLNFSVDPTNAQRVRHLSLDQYRWILIQMGPNSEQDMKIGRCTQAGPAWCIGLPATIMCCKTWA